jgi:RNA polymerase sigma factor (sigma-70 family)
MTNRQAIGFRQLRHLYSLGVLGEMTDAQLLANFVARHDSSADDSFEVLMDRHGPMVLQTCHAVLRDEHAAEDAFQATFLVLARKAGSIWLKDSLASWLHGVALRVALKARSDAIKRRRHERQVAERHGKTAQTYAASNDSQSDAQAALNEEIARLPEKYRSVTILCHLQAMTYQAAANRLGLSVDTVRGRLARAKATLRSRLSRRGVDVSAALVSARPVINALPYVSPRLFHATIFGLMARETATCLDPSTISQSAVSLSERVCKTMITTKLSTLALTLALGGIAATALVFAQSAGGPQNEPNRPATNGRSLTVATSPTQPISAALFDGVARQTVAPARAGNLIVDWNPVDPNMDKVELKIDAVRHCVHLSTMSMKQGVRPNDGAVRLDLERGKTYKIAVSGEAFMGPQTGPDADPFPGVVIVYGTDAEDGYAIRQSVVAPGKSITFKTPWLIGPDADVFLLAFVLDIWNESNRGHYSLSVTEEKTPQSSAPDQSAK